MTDAIYEQIALHVTDLAVQTTHEDKDGPSLLSRLRTAVWGNTGRTVSGAGASGVPLNLGAHVLLQELGDEIEGAFSGVIGRRGTSSSVGNLLGWHSTFGMLIATGQADETMQYVALDRARGWAQRIRDYFDAPFSIPLRDFACPRCGQARADWWDKDLEINGPAIVITLDGDDLVARCRTRGCVDVVGNPSRWVGDVDVIDLAREAGIDVDALAAEIRLARAPQADATYDPDLDVKTTVPYDHRNPEHHQLRTKESA